MSLSEQYVYLARKQARHYAERFSYRFPLDDLRSVAYFTLVEAEKTYDPTRGVGFAAYATGVIHHKMMDYVNKNTRDHRREVNISEFIHQELMSTDETFEDEFGWCPTEDEAFEAIEFFETFKHFLGTLKEDEQFLIVYRVYHPESTQVQCAAALSVRFCKKYSQVAVSHMLKRTQSKYLLYRRVA